MKVKLQKKNKGMTLIEITLVIAILLSLIAILFLGISAYKKGADRSKCILQMSTVEKLVISHGNMFGIDPGLALASTLLTSEGYLPQLPDCPDSGAYAFTEVMPSGATGSAPYTSCSNASPAHLFDPYAAPAP